MSENKSVGALLNGESFIYTAHPVSILS